MIASTRQALKRVENGADLRARLWRHARRLYRHLLDAGYELGPEPCPVIAALLDTREQALALWRGLHEHGIYVNLIFPPATPGGKSLVRISVSAASKLTSAGPSPTGKSRKICKRIQCLIRCRALMGTDLNPSPAVMERLMQTGTRSQLTQLLCG